MAKSMKKDADNPLHLGGSEGMYLVWALLGAMIALTSEPRAADFPPRTLAHQDKSCQDVTLVSNNWIAG